MKQQRGGTFLGFIIGVVAGLAVALVVAVYVTKVPMPFMNKSQIRSAEQDAAEAKKNKNWDPNAALYGKNPAKVNPGVGAALQESPDAPSEPDAKSVAKSEAKPETKPDAKAAVKIDAKTATKVEVKSEAKAELKPAVSADPLGDLVKAKVKPQDELFAYYVQLGAFNSSEEAESHRAKLSLSGIDTKISEREQSGRTVYRVRMGPFDKREEGERAKEKLENSGLDTALVRVQR